MTDGWVGRELLGRGHDMSSGRRVAAATGRRILLILARETPELLWESVLTVDYLHPTFRALGPVSSWQQARDTATRFHCDSIDIAHDVMLDMVQAGVGPILPAQDQQP